MNTIAMPYDGGGGYAVDPDTVFHASTGFLATKEFVFEIATGLAGDLSGTGGMAGGDKAGHAFAASYQPATQAVFAGIDKAGQGMAAISSRLLTMAVNYLETENRISQALGSSIDVSSGLSPDTSECEPTGSAATLPEVVGTGRHSWGLRLHDGRHFHASMMDDLGTHVTMRDYRLGHAALGTRGVYSHPTLDMRVKLIQGLEQRYQEHQSRRQGYGLAG